LTRWLRLLLLGLLAGLLLYTWPLLRPFFSAAVGEVSDLLGRTGRWGPLLVIWLQALQAVISPLPSWPITVAAGALYGPAPATLFTLIGGTAGAGFNWWIARRWGRPVAERRLPAAWLARADRLRARHFLILALLGRLIPVASFDLVAYLAGLTQIGLASFLVAAAVGQAPAVFTYAYFGADLAEAQSASLWSSLILLGLLALTLGAERIWRALFNRL
jgi:uncharacterized membrane protein YdjX (TVP38/TMEM64 family)